MSDVAATPVSRREPTGSEFIAMRDSAEFGELRRTYRSFTFPMTVAFFVWYVVYVLAAVFAPWFYGNRAWWRLEYRTGFRPSPVPHHLHYHVDLREVCQ